METAAPNVQRVSNASSDMLLRKFAELDADPPTRPYSPPRTSSSAARIFAPMVVRKKSCRAIAALSSRELTSSYADGRPPARRRRTSAGPAEWKRLLPLSDRRPPSKKSLLRRIGLIRRSDDAAPGIGLFLAMTWRTAMASASKMIVEKHCQKHVRLISDNV